MRSESESESESERERDRGHCAHMHLQMFACLSCLGSSLLPMNLSLKPISGKAAFTSFSPCCYD